MAAEGLPSHLAQHPRITLLLQVLSILDGTAITWPGVATALSDMDTLVSLGGRNMLQLDQQCQALQLQLGTTQEKAATLDSSLTGGDSSNRTHEQYWQRLSPSLLLAARRLEWVAKLCRRRVT